MANSPTLMILGPALLPAIREGIREESISPLSVPPPSRQEAGMLSNMTLVPTTHKLHIKGKRKGEGISPLLTPPHSRQETGPALLPAIGGEE